MEIPVKVERGAGTLTAGLTHRLIALRGLIPVAEHYETPELERLCVELKAHMDRVQEIQVAIRALAEKAGTQ